MRIGVSATPVLDLDAQGYALFLEGDADVVDGACSRVPVTRHAVDPDGTIADPQIREQIAATLTALAQHVAQRDAEGTGR